MSDSLPRTDSNFWSPSTPKRSLGMVFCPRKEELGPPGPCGAWKGPTGGDVIPESRSGAGPAFPRSPPPGPVPSQDAPSPLFLPVSSCLFLSPTQCWEPGQRQRLNGSRGVKSQPGQAETGPPGAVGTRSRVRTGDPGVRSPPPFLRPRSQFQPPSVPATTIRAPIPSSNQTLESEPHTPLPLTQESRSPSTPSLPPETSGAGVFPALP